MHGLRLCEEELGSVGTERDATTLRRGKPDALRDELVSPPKPARPARAPMRGRRDGIVVGSDFIFIQVRTAVLALFWVRLYLHPRSLADQIAWHKGHSSALPNLQKVQRPARFRSNRFDSVRMMAWTQSGGACEIHEKLGELWMSDRRRMPPQ